MGKHLGKNCSLSYFHLRKERYLLCILHTCIYIFTNIQKLKKVLISTPFKMIKAFYRKMKKKKKKEEKLESN